MPTRSLQLRFLARASILLIGILVLWWFLLLNPMLFLLRSSADIFGGIVFGGSHSAFVTVNASGGWTFEVPLEFTGSGERSGAAPVRYHSIDFDLSRADAATFTFGLPVCWALILAGTEVRRSLSSLAKGTLLMSAVELFLLIVFVDVFAHRAADQMSHSGTAVTDWCLRLAERLVVNVIPYLAPFLVAIWSQPDLRSHLIEFGEPH